MKRLTNRNSAGAWDVPLRNDDDGAYIPSQEIIDRLARYEDSGLEPEQCAKYAQAEKEGRLLVLPCGDDVTLEYNGLLYKGDHWNPPTLTAFATDPSARFGRRLHWFGVEEAEKALEGMEQGVSK